MSALITARWRSEPFKRRRRCPVQIGKTEIQSRGACNSFTSSTLATQIQWNSFVSGHLYWAMIHDWTHKNWVKSGEKAASYLLFRHLRHHSSYYFGPSFGHSRQDTSQGTTRLQTPSRPCPWDLLFQEDRWKWAETLSTSTMRPQVWSILLYVTVV